MTISSVVPASSLTSLPRVASALAIPTAPPVPANSRSGPGSRSEDANQRASSCSLYSSIRRFPGLLSSLTVLADSAFLIFHRGLLRPRYVLEGARQHYRIAARVDQRGEMHQHFGASLEPSSALDIAYFALYIRSRRNHNAVIHHHRKRCLRIHGIAVAGVLGGERL